ncbi:MAG: hypothetical protein ACFFDP_06285 [Promethearchaeota archaeon]
MEQDTESSWSLRIKSLFLPGLAMILSLILTSLVIASNPSVYAFVFPNEVALIEGLIVILIIGVVGGVATLITFFVFRRGGELLNRVIIAVFVSPVFFLLTIFIGQAILLLLFFQGMTNLHISLIAMASIFFSAMSLVLIFTDALSPTFRNVVFTIYGLILGVFIGCNLSWYASLALLIVLAAEDTLFATKLGETIVEADPRQHARSAFAFMIGPIMIGIGDLVVYAALTAYSLRFFGWNIAYITMGAILVGCFINGYLIVRQPNRVIPGLPIPLICALVPILISLSQITLMGMGLGLI